MRNIALVILVTIVLLFLSILNMNFSSRVQVEPDISIDSQLKETHTYSDKINFEFCDGLVLPNSR